MIGQRQNQPAGGIWYSLSKFVILLTVLTATVPILFSFLPEVKRRKIEQARLSALKELVESKRMEVARYQMEEQLLQNDPEYAGLIARDKLDLMKEGETIVRLEATR